MTYGQMKTVLVSLFHLLWKPFVGLPTLSFVRMRRLQMDASRSVLGLWKREIWPIFLVRPFYVKIWSFASVRKLRDNFKPRLAFQQ